MPKVSTFILVILPISKDSQTLCAIAKVQANSNLMIREDEDASSEPLLRSVALRLLTRGIVDAWQRGVVSVNQNIEMKELCLFVRPTHHWHS